MKKGKSKVTFGFYRTIFYILIGVVFLIYFLLDSKKTPETTLSNQEVSYLTLVQHFLNFPKKEVEDITAKDFVKYLGRMNIRSNFYESRLGSISAQKSPLKNKTIQIDLSKKVFHLYLPSSKNYRYEITNQGKKTVLGPILYNEILWNNLNNFIKTAGIDSFKGDYQKALGIWNFILNHYKVAPPPTEGLEEHDVMKALAIYGFGQCDDSSVMMNQIGKEVNLKGRIWGLSGHVVPELFVNGKWRMFDANKGIYFHPKDNPRDVYGVEELSRNPDYFRYFTTHPNSPFHGKKEVPSDITNLFLSVADNMVYNYKLPSGHHFDYYLRPGEKIVFTNSNDGKYFLSKYPGVIELYYNGYFDTPLHKESVEFDPQKLEFTFDSNVWTIQNKSSQKAKCVLTVVSPFPLVGGKIDGQLQMVGNIKLKLVDLFEDRQVEYSLSSELNINTDTFFSILSEFPTYHYQAIFSFDPSSSMAFESLRVRSDFQFAELALLKLKRGRNKIKIHSPNNQLVSSIKARVIY